MIIHCLRVLLWRRGSHPLARGGSAEGPAKGRRIYYVVLVLHYANDDDDEDDDEDGDEDEDEDEDMRTDDHRAT